MPELPEVETIRRNFSSKWPKRVARVSLSRLAPVEACRRTELQSALVGATIQHLRRQGKYLIFESDRNLQLVLHLGMSGRLRWQSHQSSRPKHTHLVLFFWGGDCLYYEDARRFGTLSLLDHAQGDNPLLNRLGPDYMDPKLTVAVYQGRLGKHPKLTIKTALLDQRIAAGLGNIYACEALYYARLHPERRVSSLAEPEVARLLRAIRHCLGLGIEHGGSSIQDYVNGLGARGMMQEFLQVYGRSGPTLDGRGTVQRITQQSRSTWFSPEQQGPAPSLTEQALPGSGIA